MRYLPVLFLLIAGKLFSQPDTSRLVRAFPVTNYIVDLTDSMKVVQLRLYEGTLVKEKQIGVLRGIYRDKHSDTSVIGYGRCHLIKGEYYYFTVNYKKSGVLPREGDLIYTYVENPKVYKGQVLKLATHFIGLQNVYEGNLYDRYTVFQKWTKQDEDALMDSIVNDIHFTGKYFLENSPGMNIKIKSGQYKDKMVLNIMINATKKDIADFFDYVIVRPRLYAGREWKVSEIFATWLSEGSPTVIKE
jgi:hypothetical protein